MTFQIILFYNVKKTILINVSDVQILFFFFEEFEYLLIIKSIIL